MPTPRQIGRLYALAARCGLNHEQALGELNERYAVTSSRQLRDHQYEEYTAGLTRRASSQPARAPQAPPPSSPGAAGAVPAFRAGAYSSADQLLDFANAVRHFGRLWPGRMTPEDSVLLAHLLNDWRLYRIRDRKLSQRQLDNLVDRLRPLDPATFRAAGVIWLEHYRTGKNEKYFFGICQHLEADRASHQAAQQGRLQLV